MDRLLGEIEVSERLGLALPTLRNWRALRRGPAYLKMGKAVRYRLADLEAYIEARRIEPEAPAKGDGR